MRPLIFMKLDGSMSHSPRKNILTVGVDQITVWIHASPLWKWHWQRSCCLYFSYKTHWKGCFQKIKKLFCTYSTETRLSLCRDGSDHISLLLMSQPFLIGVIFLHVQIYVVNRLQRGKQSAVIHQLIVFFTWSFSNYCLSCVFSEAGSWLYLTVVCKWLTLIWFS